LKKIGDLQGEFLTVAIENAFNENEIIKIKIRVFNCISNNCILKVRV
jgi:hypothetical protein